MEFFRELRELRGNQGREEEEESSTSSSAGGHSDNHHSTASKGSSSKRTPSEVGDGREDANSPSMVPVEANVPMFAEWESKTIGGRFGNICKAPKDLPAGFRFKAALHHDVADNAASIRGYKKLEEMVRQYQIPKTILIRTSMKNERACSVFRTRWVLVVRAGPNAADPQQHKVCYRIYVVVCEVGDTRKGDSLQVAVPVLLCLSTSGTRWYYVSGKEKMMLFMNVRNKVVRWKRQFIFVRDTRTKKMNNKLTARIFEWHVPNTHVNYPQLTPRDVDLKNQLLDYVRVEGLVDLKALVTPKQLVVFGFVDMQNHYTEEKMSNVLERQRQRAQSSQGRGAGSSSQRELKWHLVAHKGELVTIQMLRMTCRLFSVEQAQALSPPQLLQLTRLACPHFLHAMLSSYWPHLQLFVPPADQQRVKAHIQQHEGHVAMLKLMDAFSYMVALFECEQGAHRQTRELNDSCKQLTSEKASLVDEVNYLQSSKMANRAASAKSRANELANNVNELKEELQKVQVEKESRIHTTKDEASRVEEHAKKAEADRDKALNELNSLQQKVTEANQNIAHAEEGLRKARSSHQHSISIARARRAEWYVGSDMFPNVVAIVSLNTTMEIYNEIHGKLNEKEVLVWPPSVLEEGEDPEGLPRFDSWVDGPPEVEAEPSNTPPSSQLVTKPTRTSKAHFSLAHADASIPIDLTDD
ncbi:hypothetical protein SLEP1_g3650 [Rubroshorea leprosula]|uniref:Uncharacterized protein n=1 Tax=Rubroshorea leprosula TaxID=152421 RepID=A0AAV5HUB8_9ROSI|nr:hypothetical protein SLEP1_g3650 [Rubroshorea leprosula]